MSILHKYTKLNFWWGDVYCIYLRDNKYVNIFWKFIYGPFHRLEHYNFLHIFAIIAQLFFWLTYIRKCVELRHNFLFWEKHSFVKIKFDFMSWPLMLLSPFSRFTFVRPCSIHCFVIYVLAFIISEPSYIELFPSSHYPNHVYQSFYYFPCDRCRIF